jgi:hypothetical protein
MDREKHILKSVFAENDLVATSELVDGVKDLIPRVVRHETNERVQTDDGLFIEMVENGRCEGISNMMPSFYRINILS